MKGCHYTNAIARLAPGVSMAAAKADLDGIMRIWLGAFPTSIRARRLALELFPSEVVGKSRTAVLIIMAAGALVLLLAAINVAGLSIVRVLTRRRELAIRRALGAGSWRVIRAVLSESLVLGAMAGTVGLAIAAALMSRTSRHTSGRLPAPSGDRLPLAGRSVRSGCGPRRERAGRARGVSLARRAIDPSEALQRGHAHRVGITSRGASPRCAGGCGDDTRVRVVFRGGPAATQLGSIERASPRISSRRCPDIRVAFPSKGYNDEPTRGLLP